MRKEINPLELRKGDEFVVSMFPNEVCVVTRTGRNKKIGPWLDYSRKIETHFGQNRLTNLEFGKKFYEPTEEDHKMVEDFWNDEF